MALLFVYGTLRQGMSHHHYLVTQTSIGHAISLDHFDVIHIHHPSEPNGYPMATRTKSDTGKPLSGEIYDIDNETLRILDEYEDYPAFYDRRTLRFMMDSGKIVEAIIYCGHEK